MTRQPMNPGDLRNAWQNALGVGLTAVAPIDLGDASIAAVLNRVTDEYHVEIRPLHLGQIDITGHGYYTSEIQPTWQQVQEVLDQVATAHTAGRSS